MGNIRLFIPIALRANQKTSYHITDFLAAELARSSTVDPLVEIINGTASRSNQNELAISLGSIRTAPELPLVPFTFELSPIEEILYPFDRRYLVIRSRTTD